MSFPHHPGVGPLPPLQSQGCELAAQHSHSRSSAPAYAQRPQLPQLALPKILHPWFISSVDSCAPWGPQVPPLGTPMAGCCQQPCLQLWVSLLALNTHWSHWIHQARQLKAISHQGCDQRTRVATSSPQAWKNVEDLGMIPAQLPCTHLHKIQGGWGSTSVETCTGSSSRGSLERRK